MKRMWFNWRGWLTQGEDSWKPTGYTLKLAGHSLPIPPRDEAAASLTLRRLEARETTEAK